MSRLALINEADQFLAALTEHRERELPEARAQLEETLKLETEISAIQADAAAGRLRAEEADARIRVIRVSVAAAEKRVEEVERLEAELRQRTARAGSAAVDAMLAEERASLEQAARALAEAEQLAERRRSEHELALTRSRRVERDADALLARYDREHAKRLNDRERRKEEQIRWALRQPRAAIQQLPLDWQAEAYERYDRLQDEAAAYRKRADERRTEALLNPLDAAAREIRL
jgi:hypothetical protein